MFKLFCTLAILTTLAAQSAFARGRCCCSSDSAAPAPAAAPATPEKQPDTPAPQAQRPQETRSFSYQSSSDAAYQSMTGRYRDDFNSEPRIDGSYGQRPASDKLSGSY